VLPFNPLDQGQDIAQSDEIVAHLQQSGFATAQRRRDQLMRKRIK